MQKIQMRKRTVIDKLICNYNSLRFSLTEPIKLKIARSKYQSSYTKEDKFPLISAYIPTYNRGELLIKRSVPSILAQTYKNLELIIIGDHCTDNTEELVSKIKDPRIRFYNLPSRGYRYPPTVENHWFAGPVVAANKALDMVRGRWIARLDDDDSWTPDHLESLLELAKQGDYEFVSATHFEEKWGKRRVVSGLNMQNYYYTRSYKPAKGYNPKIGGTFTWLYRSYLTCFKYNINCWRKAWNRVNDTDISLRMFKAGVRMGFLEKPIAWYVPRPGEKTIGFEAYRKSVKEKLRHFDFK